MSRQFFFIIRWKPKVNIATHLILLVYILLCNVSIRPGYLIFRKCSDPPAHCSCRDNQEVRVSSTTPLPGNKTQANDKHPSQKQASRIMYVYSLFLLVPVVRNPYPPQNNQDIFCSSRWFFSCWVSFEIFFWISKLLKYFVKFSLLFQVQHSRQ